MSPRTVAKVRPVKSGHTKVALAGGLFCYLERTDQTLILEGHFPQIKAIPLQCHRRDECLACVQKCQTECYLEYWNFLITKLFDPFNFVYDDMQRMVLNNNREIAGFWKQAKKRPAPNPPPKWTDQINR